MILYDATTIHTAPFPDTAEGRGLRSFLVPLVQHGPGPWFEDRARMFVLGLDDLLIPLSVTDGTFGNSVLYSVYERFIGSQRKAIRTGNWKPLAGFAASSALWGVGAVMKTLRLDKAVQVDCWPSLRNAGANLTEDQARRLTEFLTTRFPDHAPYFLAVNPVTHAALLNHLQAQGYDFAYMTHTRMMLPFEPELERRVRENRRRDARLLEPSGYRVVDARELPGCAPRLAELYRRLHREKYATNPPISVTYMEEMLAGSLLDVRALVKDGRVDMFYATVVVNGVMFSPVSGYDTSLPQEVGLYRLINNLLMRDAQARGVMLETGGGADPFKTLRGDRPVPRYNAVYLRHLPSWRHTPWRLAMKVGNEQLLPFSRKRLHAVDGEANVVGFDRVPEVFAPTLPTPREATARQEQELTELEQDLARTEVFSGNERVRHLGALRKRLEDEQLPPARVAPLLERWEHLSHAPQADKKEKRKAQRAVRAELARRLLETATTVGDTTVVCHHLGDGLDFQPRTLAEQLRKGTGSIAVVLTSTRDGTLELVTALAPPLVERGLEARRLLEQMVPPGGAGREGGAELAWAEAALPDDDVSAVLERARAVLHTRLSIPT
ncbi:GNAT family N-acetyltransferase [Corallococcus exercitus]|nr:GNAT family N-acetyltransferase [Corallococcus exercitus]